MRNVVSFLNFKSTWQLTLLYRSSYATADDSNDYVRRNKYRLSGEWLADNVTGTAARSAAGGGSIEYRVNRKNLRLRNGPDDERKRLTLSAYAANRMGRGPLTNFGSDNVMLLRHPWWWSGESAYESSTRTDGPAGTSSTGTFCFFKPSSRMTFIYVRYIINKY
jgi:hypothetical protein